MALSTKTFGSGRGAAFLLVLLVAALPACNKDPAPKPTTDEPKKSTPVPDDMVLNDFLPSNGKAEIAVKVDGGAAVPETGGGAAAAASGNGMTVTNPGAEPRQKRVYAFVPGKTERRTLVARNTMSAQGRTQEEPALSFTVEFVAKEAKPTGTKMEMKVVKVELADKDKVDPRMAQAAAQQLGALAGLTATFQVSPSGEASEVSMAGKEAQAREGAAELLGAVAQFAELVVAPLPEEPIGVGAKWERSDTEMGQAGEEKSKRTLELKDLDAAGNGTIVVTIDKRVAKRPMPDPRMPEGSTVEVEATGQYTYSMRFDRIASKVVGEQKQLMKVEVPNPQNPREVKKVTQEVVVKHTLETPGGK